jgi:hypothetical protein
VAVLGGVRIEGAVVVGKHKPMVLTNFPYALAAKRVSTLREQKEGNAMRPRITLISLVFLTLMCAIIVSGAKSALAHCDGLDGPVVKAAQAALESGDVNLVLICVQKQDEAEIKKAFHETLAVRKLSPEAKSVADRYFFETLVRIHRVGEGAPYTGLKPAGRDLGPAIPAADKALEDGSVEPVVKLITDAAQHGIREHFNRALMKKKLKKGNVGAGREYIEAYVSYIHYVEQAYEAAKNPAHGHYPEAEEAEGYK